MGKQHLVLLVVAGLVVVYGCVRIGDCCGGVEGSGMAATEARQVAGFEAVAMRGSGRLIIEQADNEALTVTADDNILPLLKSEVSGSELELGPANGANARPKTAIVYRLTVKNLSAVKIHGSGNVEAQRLQTEALLLSVSGSGDFHFGHLTAKKLTVEVHGSGSLVAQGEAAEQVVAIHGSGDFNGEHLQGQAATVDIAGSGDAVVNVAEKLSVQVSGSGKVRYIGSPAMNVHIAGSGSVQQKAGT